MVSIPIWVLLASSLALAKCEAFAQIPARSSPLEIWGFAGKISSGLSFRHAHSQQLQMRLFDGPVQLVKRRDSKYTLKYIDRVEGAITRTEEVPSFVLENNVGMSVTAIKQGGNMVSVSKNGTEYGEP